MNKEELYYLRKDELISEYQKLQRRNITLEKRLKQALNENKQLSIPQGESGKRKNPCRLQGFIQSKHFLSATQLR